MICLTGFARLGCPSVTLARQQSLLFPSEVSSLSQGSCQAGNDRPGDSYLEFCVLHGKEPGWSHRQRPVRVALRGAFR